jgi:hypothetical protein
MTKKFFITTILAFLPTFAWASEFREFTPSGYYITPLVGSFDVFDNNRSALAGLEAKVWSTNYKFISPKIGAFVTNHRSTYVYAGVNFDLPIMDDKLFLSPGFAIGAYYKGKRGKNLGGTFEIKSSLELAYKRPNLHKLGLELSHISNAGVYKKNPGQENLILNYSIPY